MPQDASERRLVAPRHQLAARHAPSLPTRSSHSPQPASSLSVSPYMHIALRRPLGRSLDGPRGAPPWPGRFRPHSPSCRLLFLSHDGCRFCLAGVLQRSPVRSRKYVQKRGRVEHAASRGGRGTSCIPLSGRSTPPGASLTQLQEGRYPPRTCHHRRAGSSAQYCLTVDAVRSDASKSHALCPMTEGDVHLFSKDRWARRHRRTSTEETAVARADKWTHRDLSIITYLDSFCCYNKLWDANFTLLLITINARRDEAGRREPQLYAALVLPPPYAFAAASEMRVCEGRVSEIQNG